MPKKRSFINNITNSIEQDNNPAMQFISSRPKQPVHAAAATGTVESKTKRVQLLVQPSVLEQVKNVAAKQGISINEVFNIAVKKYIDHKGA